MTDKQALACYVVA